MIHFVKLQKSIQLNLKLGCANVYCGQKQNVTIDIMPNEEVGQNAKVKNEKYTKNNLQHRRNFFDNRLLTDFNTFETRISFKT